MYEECITCPKMGKTCDGPNFAAMSSSEFLDWCRSRTQHLQWTQARLSEESGIPKGTVGSLFAGKQTDFRHDTMRPMIRALIGGEFSGSPCANIPAEMENKYQQLEDENAELTDKIARHDRFHQDNTNYLRGQMRIKNFAIGILGALLFVAVTVIIGALLVDNGNPDIGFIWRG